MSIVFDNLAKELYLIAVKKESYLVFDKVAHRLRALKKVCWLILAKELGALGGSREPEGTLIGMTITLWSCCRYYSAKRTKCQYSLTQKWKTFLTVLVIMIYYH